MFFFRIVSFGAPSTNEYRLVVEGQAAISLQTSMVGILLLPISLWCPTNITILLYVDTSFHSASENVW